VRRVARRARTANIVSIVRRMEERAGCVTRHTIPVSSLTRHIDENKFQYLCYGFTKSKLFKKNAHMKKFVIYTIVGAILYSIAGCVTATNDKEEKEKLKIGYLPIAECLPLYVAKEKGFFEKYGLDVELVSATGGPVIFTELKAGTIDIGFSNVVSLIKQANSGNSYSSVFGATYESLSHVNHGMFVARDSDTTNLSGKIFGLNARNNIEELMLLNYLKGKGVEINQALLEQFKEIPFPQMLTSLKDKTINVACVVEPFITTAKNDTTNYRYLGNHYAGNYQNRILVATYVAKNTFVHDNAQVIKKFISAMSDATAEINEDNNVARSWITKYTRMDEKLLSKISLPEFAPVIETEELTKIIKLMYNDTINRYKGFIPNPGSKVESKQLIYKP
jgi:NitT/TauT family transport system substrate-binding protein